MSNPKQTNARTSGFGSVFKSITRSLKPASGNVPVVINAKVVGGGADMQKLLSQLQNGSTSARAQVASQITDALEKYYLSSIPEVWYLARDLCDRQHQSSVRRSALKLLTMCIKQDEDAVSNKLMFYSDIVTFCKVSESRLDEEFDLFLEALKALTNDGRDIHDLYIYDQEGTFAQFVFRCFKVLASQAKKYKDGPDPPSEDKSFHNLVNFTNYITNCVQFNYALTEDHFFSLVLEVIVHSSLETGNLTILSAYLDLVKYSIVIISTSEETYQPVIKLLCYIFATFPSLSQSCSDLIKQCCIESPDLVVSTLGSVIYNNEVVSFNGDSDLTSNSSRGKGNDSIKHIYSCLGAISILESVFIKVSSDRRITDIYVLIDQAYDDIVDALSLRIPLINSAFLSMFSRLFDLDEHNHTSTTENIFTKLFPFYSWYSASRSIFSLLRYMDINSDQDAESWLTICDSLLQKYTQQELTAPRDALVNLFMTHSLAVSEHVALFSINYFKEEKLCQVVNSSWKGNCQRLLNAYYYPTDASSESKRAALECIKEAHEASLTLFDDSSIGRVIILDILEHSFQEEDSSTLEYLFGDFLHDFMSTSSLSLLKMTTELFQLMLKPKHKTEERPKSIRSLSSSGYYFQNNSRQYSIVSERSTESKPPPNTKISTLLARSLSRFFITSASSDPEAAVQCYHFIIAFLKYCIEQTLVQASIALLRSLVRLRVTNQGNIFFTDVMDMGGLASAFKRASADPNFDGSKTIFWEYPESFPQVPQSYFDKVSRIKLRLNNGSGLNASEGQAKLDIKPWVDIVHLIMSNYYHWEIYSFVAAHYCSQLSNMSLFEDQQAHILELQKTVCDQLMLNLPTTEPFPTENTSVTKSDLQVALVRTLSSLIGYHHLFTKADEDQIVSSVIFAMGSYERTAIPCIHILNVCCYETPLSIKKFLTAILTKLQTGLTSSFASPPTLEFMMSIISSRAITSSFTIDDYKRFFAIAFKYIQYASMLRIQIAQGKNSKEQDQVLQTHGVDAEVEQKASTQITPITPIMNEYLYLISYRLIARLFLTINLNDRGKLRPFILRNLDLANQINEAEVNNESTIALADFLIRFAASDVPLKVVLPPKSMAQKSNELSNSWLLGSVLMTITTNTTDGDSMITVRRPTNVSVFRVQLDPSMVRSTTHTDGNQRLVLNSYFLLQMTNFLEINERMKPVPLLDDAATERALGALDRAPVVTFHKAGVIYIGPGQTDERDILGNSAGSVNYHKFLDSLGKLVRLEDTDSVYVGGLDKENGSDGRYAYIWSDTVSQTAFHVTTLMPNVATDKYHSFKKRHIGNNHVNVFFDESGHSFNFNVIKSQFNFLNIVITPHTPLQRTTGGVEAEVFKVKTFRRHGVPGIFSTSHFKLISAEQLPTFIRNSIMISDKFAQVWHNCNNGEYVSNWQLRVRQIELIRKRTLELHKTNQEQQSNLGGEKLSAKDGAVGGPNSTVPDVISSDMTDSFLEQLQGGVKNGGGNETFHAVNPNYDYSTGDDNKPYLWT